jgi:endoglucanase
VLSDQLDIYDRHGAGWSIWTYKDVGLHGLVEVRRDSAYQKRFSALIAKKRRLGVDAWGSTHAELPEVIEPLHALIAREFPTWSPYPWGAREATDLLVRHILLAQAMLGEYAERFRGLSDDELDELADSFALEHCRRRGRLCEIIASRVSAVE